MRVPVTPEQILAAQACRMTGNNERSDAGATAVRHDGQVGSRLSLLGHPGEYGFRGFWQRHCARDRDRRRVGFLVTAG